MAVLILRGVGKQAECKKARQRRSKIMLVSIWDIAIDSATSQSFFSAGVAVALKVLVKLSNALFARRTMY